MARADQPQGKIAAIQLLRAIAAFTVAAGHIAFAFADHIGGGLGIGRDDAGLGQVAVMLFFIVSGMVMVIAAAGDFGRPRRTGRFWRRRAIRIMPPYWLASLLLAAIFLTLQPRPIDLAQFARSLLLVPFWPDDGTLRPVPFLWVGWTLFYEMAFYAVFGLFLGLPRARAIAATAAVLAALVLAGSVVPPESAVVFALTRPVLVMFVAGMALGLWRSGGGQAPWWLRLLALAGVAPALALIPAPPPTGAMGFDYLAWCGTPALLIAFAVLAGPLRLPAARLVIALGDMSYALYLLHVPMAWLWLWLWPRVPGFDPGAWDFLVSALAATLAASWLFHTRIERPLTAILNSRAGSPHEGQIST